MKEKESGCIQIETRQKMAKEEVEKLGNIHTKMRKKKVKVEMEEMRQKKAKVEVE